MADRTLPVPGSQPACSFIFSKCSATPNERVSRKCFAADWFMSTERRSPSTIRLLVRAIPLRFALNELPPIADSPSMSCSRMRRFWLLINQTGYSPSEQTRKNSNRRSDSQSRTLASQRQRCYIVQRLDLYTSGVLLLRQNRTRSNANQGQLGRCRRGLPCARRGYPRSSASNAYALPEGG